MKKIHIVSFIMLAAGIFLFISASKDTGTFHTFTQALKSESPIKISGQLSKDKEIYYNPEKDPNYFSFFMKDSEGIEKQVVLLNKKPQDFERSETIVLTGNMVDDKFMATDMLLKCPSKYKQEEIYVRSEVSL